MKRVVLFLVLVFASKYAFGCTCRQSLNSYFLNQVKDFDAIVEGKFYRDRKFWTGYIIIDKVHKGNFPKDTVEIVEGGTDCTEAFIEDPDRTLILGIYKSRYESESDVYSAPSCVTSVLVVNGGKVESKTKFYNLHLRRPRIGLSSTVMSKDKFEKRIKRRL